MRVLLILALVAGCSHKSAPTDDWCQTYVNALRTRAKSDVHAMTLNDTNRRFAAERLRAMVGSAPALEVAFKVCSDAANDSLADQEARQLRLNDLHAKVGDYLATHDEATLDHAQVTHLEQLFDQLANAYAK